MIIIWKKKKKRNALNAIAKNMLSLYLGKYVLIAFMKKK